MTASGTAPTPYLRRVRLARKNSASPVSACNRSTKRASVSGLGTSNPPESMRSRCSFAMLALPLHLPSWTSLIAAFLTRLTCLVGRPPPIFNFERCEGHLPLARSDRYQASKSRAPIIRIPMVSSPSNFTSPSAVLIVVTAAVRRCPARSRRGPNPIDAFFSMTGDGFGFAVEQCSTAAAPAGLERPSSLFFRCIFSGRPALNGVDAWGNECVGASTDQGNRLLGPQNACLAEALPQEIA